MSLFRFQTHPPSFSAVKAAQRYGSAHRFSGAESRSAVEVIHRAVSRAAHPNGRRRAADTLARDRQSGDGSVGHRGDGRRT